MPVRLRICCQRTTLTCAVALLPLSVLPAAAVLSAMQEKQQQLPSSSDLSNAPAGRCIAKDERLNVTCY